jgi:hypothetical protein
MEFYIGWTTSDQDFLMRRLLKKRYIDELDGICFVDIKIKQGFIFMTFRLKNANLLSK